MSLYKPALQLSFNTLPPESSPMIDPDGCLLIAILHSLTISEDTEVLTGEATMGLSLSHTDLAKKANGNLQANLPSGFGPGSISVLGLFDGSIDLPRVSYRINGEPSRGIDTRRIAIGLSALMATALDVNNGYHDLRKPGSHSITRQTLEPHAIFHDLDDIT